jgi:hypothetical protein
VLELARSSVKPRPWGGMLLLMFSMFEISTKRSEL